LDPHTPTRSNPHFLNFVLMNSLVHVLPATLNDTSLLSTNNALDPAARTPPSCCLYLSKGHYKSKGGSCKIHTITIPFHHPPEFLTGRLCATYGRAIRGREEKRARVQLSGLSSSSVGQEQRPKYTYLFSSCGEYL